MTWSPDHTFAVEAGGRAARRARRRPRRGGRRRRGADPAAGRRLAPEVPDRWRGRGRALSGSPRSSPPTGQRRQAVGLAVRLAPPCRRRRPSAASAAPASRAAGRTVPRAAATGTLRFANWIGYIDIDEDDQSFPTLEQVHGRDRDRGQLPRGHRRQRELLHDPPVRAARGRPADRVGHRRRHRLDGRPAGPPRLARDDRSGEHAELRGQPAAALQRPLVRPDTNLAAPWQSGMTGPRLRPGQDRRPQASLDVFFSDEFAGKMTYLDEMRDTIGLTALQLGLGPGDAHRGAVRRRPGRGRQGGQDAAGSARSRATPTSRTWPAATPSWRWPGRATWLLVLGPDRARTRTSRGSSPTRAGCSGPTTWPSRRARPTSRMAESWIDFYYDPMNAADDRGVRQLRLPGRRAPARSCSGSTRTSPTTR